MKRVPMWMVLMVFVAAGAGCGRPAETPSTTAPAVESGQPGQAAQPPPPVKPVPAELPLVVARVNGEAIERWELESVLKQAEARAGSAVPADQRDTVLRDLLDDLVNYHLLAQESLGRKINVAEADVDAQVKNIRQSFPTDVAFLQAVADRGLTLDRLRQQERRNLQARKLIDLEIASKVTIADTEVDTFYQQNLDKFKEGEPFHASHIFVAAAPDADAAVKNQARAKAQQILKDLRAGADFAALAREHSDDTTGPKGGDLGFVGKGDLPPDFENVVFALKPGSTSEVVDLGAGFHIIRLHERRPARTVPLEEMRAQVKEFLTQDQLRSKLDQFVDQTKAKSKIEILV